MMSINDELSTMVELPDDHQLSSIADIAELATKLHSSIENAEMWIKSAKQELHQLTTKTLPDAMASAGVSEFKTEKGYKITINDFVSGSLPKEAVAHDLALQWLEDNGADGLIKNQLRAAFDKGEDNVAGEVRGLLDKLGVEFECKRDVHPQTLAAFARERMRNGESVPLETLGLFAGRAAKISLPSR